MHHRFIVIFDGVCNLCESTVIFIIRRDKLGKYKFASAQSDAGKKLQFQYGLNALELGTMILIKDGLAYTKSDAVIGIAEHLDGCWKLLVLFKIIPKKIRDWAYTRVSKNRYQWFGKKRACMMPSKDIKARFLG
jgi:predicted DCC family thiol-disulfide oxidoreductase YuxK